MNSESDNSKIKGKVCPNCGGHLNINTEDWTAVCQYCGAEFQPDFSDQEKIELTKVSAKSKLERDKFEYEISKDKKAEEERIQKEYKKSKRFKATIVFTILFGIVTLGGLGQHVVISGLIAAVQTALMILSVLFGLQIIKCKNQKISTFLFIIALVLIIPFMAFINTHIDFDSSDSSPSSYEESDEDKTFDWDSLKMSEKLPDPGTNKGYDYGDNSLDVYEYTSEKYNDYLDECKDKGFTIDPYSEYTDNYSAFDKEGYKLRISFDDYSSEMSIELKDPISMSEIVWPDTGLAAKIPTPKSLQGNIVDDSSSFFDVYIDDVSMKGFQKYVNRCKKKGFTVDYSSDDRYFNGQNKKGDDLTVRYYGNNIMEIDVSKGDYEEDTSQNTEKKEKKKDKKKKDKKKSSKKKSGGSKDFKEVMDKYEDAVDAYIAASKDPTSAEYFEATEKYYDFMSDVDDIDEDELSTSDLEYYNEVMTRVSNKLIKAGL